MNYIIAIKRHDSEEKEELKDSIMDKVGMDLDNLQK